VAGVSLEGLTKIYPNGFKAVDGVDLDIPEGEFMVLVGPSGCGKTTLLRMVAGLEEITSGTLRIGDRVANDVPPGSRDIAMVFQSYALFPHMTVANNIGFPLKLKHVAKQQIDSRVRATAEILGITECLSRKPGQLSGGQRQRVAMGRAIVVSDPTVFLMDEPLSNLDAKLRVQMRAEVSRLQKRLGIATLYVTHDQTEALTMGNRVAVLRQGVLQQCDKPQNLYDRPANLFVAAFIGSPEMNLYESTVDNGSSLRLGSQEIRLPVSMTRARPSIAAYAGRRLVVGIRPEHLSVAAGEWTGPVLKADVTLKEGLGSQMLVHFKIDAPRAQTEDVRAAAEEELTDSEVASIGDGIAVVDARTQVTTGHRVCFAVDPERLHFFDPQTGDAVLEAAEVARDLVEL
jgi:multiple sugar transport system ATP-binding protein